MALISLTYKTDDHFYVWKQASISPSLWQCSKPGSFKGMHSSEMYFREDQKAKEVKAIQQI